MSDFFVYDTNSVIDEYFDQMLEFNSELREKYEKCETEDERLELKNMILEQSVDDNTLPTDVEKCLINQKMESCPDEYKFPTNLKYNEFSKWKDNILLFEMLPSREVFKIKETIFTMIGFMYRILSQEYKEDDPRYEVISEYLKFMFEYNPEKHYSALEKHFTSNYKIEDNKLIGDPNSLYYNEELNKILNTPPAEEQIRNIFRYKNTFSNEIRELTSQFYVENPGVENTILIHGAFPDTESVDRFCKKYADKFVSDPIRAEFWKPTILSDFYLSKQKFTPYAKDDADQVLNSIFESYKKQQELTEKIMKNKSDKQMQKLSPEDIALLKKYEGVRKSLASVAHRSEEQNTELYDAESKIDAIKDKMIPPGTQPIIVKDIHTKKENVILTEI